MQQQQPIVSSRFGSKLVRSQPAPVNCEKCEKTLYPVRVGEFWMIPHCKCAPARKETPLTLVKPRNNVKGGDMDRVGDLLTQSQYHPKPKPAPRACMHCGSVVEPLELPTGSWKDRSCACERDMKDYNDALTEQWYTYLRQRVRCYGGWLGPRYKDLEIAANMMSMSFDSWNQNLHSGIAVDLLQYAHNRHNQNLILFSKNYGTGKTHLASAISNYMMQVWGVASVYATVPQFFDAYFGAMHSRGDDKSMLVSMQEVFAKVPLLILDEVEGDDERRREVFQLLLNERYMKQRPTILITNKPEGLPAAIGAKIYSRLCTNVRRYNMNGDDYRVAERLSSTIAERNAVIAMNIKALRKIDFIDSQHKGKR